MTIRAESNTLSRDCQRGRKTRGMALENGEVQGEELEEEMQKTSTTDQLCDFR
jgi:hypothetical protein